MIKRIRAAFAAFFVAGTIVAGAPALAVPGICVMPTTGTVSGLTLVQDINNCFGAALGLFAAGAAPGSPTSGMLWWNTSTGQVAQYDGANWNNLWNVDPTNHLNAVQIGGGVQATLASASTTDLWSMTASSIAVTGTTAITQLANADAVPGSIKIVTFAGALTLTQGGGTGGAPLNLPNNGGNITTATGDYAIVLALTATNVQVIQYTRATGAALSTAGLNIGSGALGASALGSFQQPVNLQINTSVASNQLTVAIKGINGADPATLSNPVLVGFRSQTPQPNGTNILGTIAGALSFTLTTPTTNSMGCTTAVLCRLWVTLVCQTELAGACTSVLVGLSTQSTAGQVFQLSEDVLQSTGAGTGGGTTAGVIQTSVASLSGKAIRIVGFVEVVWTSGTGWGSPTKVQLFGPGVHKPGDVVQSLYESGSLSLAITPTSAVNLVKFAASISCAAPASASAVGMLFKRGSTTLASQFIGGTSSTGLDGIASVLLLDAPGTSSSVTYSFAGSGSTCTVVGSEIIELDEIMGALDLEKLLPANDAGAPLRLVG
jgi:hypothetical protein